MNQLALHVGISLCGLNFMMQALLGCGTEEAIKRAWELAATAAYTAVAQLLCCVLSEVSGMLLYGAACPDALMYLPHISADMGTAEEVPLLSHFLEHDETMRDTVQNQAMLDPDPCAYKQALAVAGVAAKALHLLFDMGAYKRCWLGLQDEGALPQVHCFVMNGLHTSIRSAAEAVLTGSRADEFRRVQELTVQELTGLGASKDERCKPSPDYHPSDLCARLTRNFLCLEASQPVPLMTSHNSFWRRLV
jgi:hypothetical protein